MVLAENNRAFEGVVEFANVPLPRRGQEHAHRRVVHAVDAFAECAPMTIEQGGN